MAPRDATARSFENNLVMAIWERLKIPGRSARNAVAELLRRLPISSEVAGPPKDEDRSFDDFLERESIWTKHATAKVIFPSKPVCLPAARIFGSAPTGFLAAKSYDSDAAVMFDCPGARIFNRPLAIISPDDRLFIFASCWHSARVRSHFAFHQLRLGRVQRLEGRTLYLGGSGNVWHFYADTLRQLALLRHAGRTLMEFDHVIVKMPTTPIERRFYVALGLAGDQLLDAEAYRHVKCDHLTFFSTASNRRGAEEGALLRPFVFRSLGIADGARGARRLYVSRAKAEFRRVLNESALRGMLEARGFAPLLLEDMTVDDQICAFRDAELVVGLHGAGLAHILFCRPNAALIELRNLAFQPENWASESYRVTAGLLGLHYLTVLACEVDGDPDPHKSDVSFKVHDVENAIEAAEKEMACGS